MSTEETSEATSEATGKEKRVCSFPGCGNKAIARKLCVSHYRQALRGKPLRPLRLFRGLVRLPMVIRVEEGTLAALEQRVKEGRAVSMYDSTRQALEAGVLILRALDKEIDEKKKQLRDDVLKEKLPKLLEAALKGG